MRQLSPEGVLGLAPSLILAIEGTGPKETLSVLSSAKVPMVLVPDPFSADGIVEKIEIIAKATGAQNRGACLAESVRADLAVLAALRKDIDRPARVMFVLSFLNGRAMVAGRNTAADGIIRHGGRRQRDRRDTRATSRSTTRPSSQPSLISSWRWSMGRNR